MNTRNVLVTLCLMAVGCDNLLVSQPANTKSPVLPEVTSPAESYWKGYASAVESRKMICPHDIYENIVILVRWKQLSDADAKKFEAGFPGAAKDTTPFSDVKSAADKLRSIK